MRNNQLICLFATLLLSALHLQAQPPCAFDIQQKRKLETDPAFARRLAENESSILNYIERHPELRQPGSKRGNGQRPNALYTIPVVVHVMHTGGAVGTIYNPSDANILGAINYLNQVFAGTYPGMTPPVGGSSVVDMEIQFALAQRTPTCNATNGINRVNASSIPNYVANGVNAAGSAGVNDVDLKDFSRWDPSQYYNIWVVNKIDGADGTSGQFIAGFAYFAGSGSDVDGTVMLATQMVSGAKTLPHEIGHALNLYHTFEGSAGTAFAQCQPNTSCASTGDRVCDTDPVNNNVSAGGVYNFSCRAGTNQCTATPYTINTESNFMAYTNCYTLFTDGQKARVQAAMSLPDRASLVSPGNLALTPCTAVINFAQATSSRAESTTGTTVGCRTYTDYTYQAGVGSAPSAAATATLLYTGSATKGVDYDVTTNGNFSSPSDVLTFPAGSTANQSFTVRIYDDGEVEGTQNIVIDFNLINGGGNATKGVHAPTLTIGIADNDNHPVGNSPVVATTGLSNIGVNQPFRGQFSDARTQSVYTVAQLNAAGLTGATSITAIAFNVVSKVSTGPFNNFTVRLKNTSTSTLSGGLFETGATQVFTGNYSTTLGINTITFSTPFVWNGTDNLLVDICFDNNTATGAGVGSDFVAGTAGLPQCHFTRLDGVSGCSITTAQNIFSGNAVPDIQITGTSLPTSVETVSGSTSSRHIVNGSNDYFYSNNGKLMMQLSGVNADLNCVNTSLEGAGTSWVNFQGGQRSAKIFAVTPATNGATTTYTVSFYFDNSELDGKTASGLRIAKSSAAAIGDANSTNTVIVTPVVTTLGDNTTVYTATFTGFSLFFLVDPAVTLPVSLVDFTARLDGNNNTQVNWETSSELNNKEFTVEISRDGSLYAPLGSIASRGNSSVSQRYNFVHIKPQAGTNWYRLKQTDHDGRYTYSKVVTVKVDHANFKPFLYPVPASNRITINFGKMLNKTSIRLLSSDMRTIKQESVSGLSLQHDLDISGLAAGVYFIKVEGLDELLRFVKH